MMLSVVIACAATTHQALSSARSVLVPVAFLRRQSRATSSLIFRSAINRSIARIRGTISSTCDRVASSPANTQSDAQDFIRKFHARSVDPPRLRPATMRSPNLPRRCGARRAADSAAALPSAKSMPVHATPASWKSMRSTMHSTTWSGLGFASSLHHAMLMCCW